MKSINSIKHVPQSVRVQTLSKIALCYLIFRRLHRLSNNHESSPNAVTMVRARKSARTTRSKREQQKVRFLLQHVEPGPDLRNAASMTTVSSTSAPNQLDSGQQARLEDALNYVGQVKSRFNHKLGVWHRFQEIPEDVRDYPSNTPEEASRDSSGGYFFVDN